MVEPLQALLSEAARRLRAARATSALLIHHNDADGLTSGALLGMALEAEGCAVQCLAVEKIFPEVSAAKRSDSSSASICKAARTRSSNPSRHAATASAGPSR
jgi:single-stranded DNA-specific DHH superfamily exonuclease